MNAMQKAIRSLQKKCKPIKDENGFEYYSTNNIVFAIDIAIKKVFDDIEKRFPAHPTLMKEYRELKKRHLSTFDKSKGT